MPIDGVNKRRRRFLVATTTVVGAVGAGFAAVPFIQSWQPSAKARSMGSPVQVDVEESPAAFYPIYVMLNNAFTDRMDKVGNLLS